MEIRRSLWALFLMLYPSVSCHVCLYQMTCGLRFSQCEHVPFSFSSFQWKVLIANGCLRHLTRPPLWTPMNITLCWSVCVTHILAYSWRRHLMKNKHVTKMRFIVLTVIPIGIIPDTQTRLSDGCSGLMLFLSQRVCQALYKTEASSACGCELYFWYVLCSSGVPAARWIQSLVVPSKWTLDHSVHDDYACNFFLDDLVISSGTKPDVNNVPRGSDQQRSLDCSSQGMIDAVVSFQGVYSRLTLLS